MFENVRKRKNKLTNIKMTPKINKVEHWSICMIADERRNRIVDYLAENTYVSVEVLAKEFDVSQMTIRRDLETLSSSGVIERRHGGAVLKEEVTYREKNIANASAKEKIASKAITFIKTGDTVFLDAGTTTFQIAKMLAARKDLTIITNDVEIAYYLRDAQPTLLLCGGLMQKETGSLIGDFTHQMLEQINFDVAFIGTSSIDQDFFCSTPSFSKSALKRTAIRKNNETYLVVDASKFNKSALVRTNPLEDFTSVITDKKFSIDEQRQLSDRGIRIIEP